MRLILFFMFVSVLTTARSQSSDFRWHIDPNQAIINPTSGCEVGDVNEVINVYVINFGPDNKAVWDPDVAMNYTINGGPVTTKLITGGVNSGSAYNFLFDPTDLSACDTFDITVWVDYPNDPDHSNDTLSWQFVNSCTVVPGTINGSTRVCQGMNSGQLELNGWQQGNIVDWEYTTDWTNWIASGIPVTDTIYNYSNIWDSTEFRVIIDGVYCPNDTAYGGALGVDSISIAGTLVGDINVCEGTDTAMFANPIRGQLTAWLGSPDGLSIWTVLPGSSDTFAINAPVSDVWYQYVVQNGVCPPDTSNIAYLDVDIMPNAGTAVTGAGDVCAVFNGDSIQVSGYSGVLPGWIASTNGGNTWTGLNDTTDNHIFVNITDTTTYAFVVANGMCPPDTSNWVTINTVPAPVVTAGPDVTITEGDSVMLTATGGIVGFWQPSQYLDDSTSYTPLCVPPVDTNDHSVLTLTYVFFAANAAGCINSDTVVVTVNPDLVPPYLWEPLISNVLTTNGDGINDSWYIENVELYPGTEVFVYNIYGQEIFASSDYRNDFDGTYNGNSLPDGVYKYVITVGGADKTFKGTLTILGE